jgi:chaperonin GroEL
MLRLVRRFSYKAIEIVYGEDARQTVFRGIQLVEKTVACTLGPKGKNVAIDYELGMPKLTKDGVTVAKHIEFRDTLLDLGAKLIKFPAHESNKFAGDGTTTSTILANAIMKHGIEMINRGYHPLAIKRGLDHACNLAIKYIEDRAIPVTREEEIVKLAEVATNYDKHTARIVADAVIKAGKHGVINIEEGSTFENQLHVIPI